MSSQTHDDLAFLQNPDQWPNWPVCPVKRYVNNQIVCGIVTAEVSTVVILNLFTGWTPEQYDAAQKFVYEDFEKLLADGWVVD